MKKYDIAIAFTAHNKEKCTKIALDHLERCVGVENCIVVAHCEPGYPAIESMMGSIKFADVKTVVNPHRFGCIQNFVLTINHAFEYCDYVLWHVDDFALCRDGLQYHSWCKNKYRNDPTVFNVGSFWFSRSRSPDRANAVFRRRSFNDLLLGLWDNRWREILKYIHRYSYSNDNNICGTNSTVSGKRYEILPFISRTRWIPDERKLNAHYFGEKQYEQFNGIITSDDNDAHAKHPEFYESEGEKG